MKYVYCRGCDAVSVLATLEPDVCAVCRKPAVLVPMKRPWQSWASTTVILGGAVFLAVANFPELWIRVGVLLPFLAVGFALASWGMKTAKQSALERARRAEAGR